MWLLILILAGCASTSKKSIDAESVRSSQFDESDSHETGEQIQVRVESEPVTTVDDIKITIPGTPEIPATSTHPAIPARPGRTIEHHRERTVGAVDSTTVKVAGSDEKKVVAAHENLKVKEKVVEEKKVSVDWKLYAAQAFVVLLILTAGFLYFKLRP